MRPAARVEEAQVQGVGVRGRFAGEELARPDTEQRVVGEGVQRREVLVARPRIAPSAPLVCDAAVSAFCRVCRRATYPGKTIVTIATNARTSASACRRRSRPLASIASTRATSATNPPRENVRTVPRARSRRTRGRRGAEAPGARTVRPRPRAGGAPEGPARIGSSPRSGPEARADLSAVDRGVADVDLAEAAEHRAVGVRQLLPHRHRPDDRPGRSARPDHRPQHVRLVRTAFVTSRYRTRPSVANPVTDAAVVALAPETTAKTTSTPRKATMRPSTGVTTSASRRTSTCAASGTSSSRTKTVVEPRARRCCEPAAPGR